MSLSSSVTTCVEETLHGVLVKDPYRWLEQRDAPETEVWVLQQQERCEKYFASSELFRTVRQRVEEFLDTEVIDQPTRVADRYFYRRRCRGEQQARIYTRCAITGVERMLLAPSPEDPLVSVRIYRISADGLLLAYERRDGGSDRKSIHFIEVSTGRNLNGSIPLGYITGFCFAQPLGGFFYSREEDGRADDQVIRLQRFDSSDDDKICLHAAGLPGSRWILTVDSSYVVASLLRKVGDEHVCDLWLASCADPTSWRRIAVGRHYRRGATLHDGHLYAISYDESSTGKLVELGFDGGEIRTVIPSQDAKIQQLVLIDNYIFANRLCENKYSIQCCSLNGTQMDNFSVSALGTVRLLPDLSGASNSLFYITESLSSPPQIVEYDPAPGQSRSWHQRTAPPRRPGLIIREERYSSKDGVAIPVTIASYRPTSPVTSGPCMLSAYGGFGVSMTPRFSTFLTILLELGFTIAVPHIRGGGEFGEEWHRAARGKSRQVGIDDFITAAEWLCAQKLTTPGQLSIAGSSNGGLLVGAALTQRPELFRAVLCVAPLLDMIRYAAFDRASRWLGEYGSIENEEQFQALHGYSPYHHVAHDTNYPSVLLVSGDRDDRCNPAHVRKMAAALQNRAAQYFPVVVDYSEERGHVPVLPLSARVDALSRRIAFLCEELNVSVPEGGWDEEARA